MNTGNINRIIKMPKQKKIKRKPGVCVPWDEKKKELPKILGDEKVVQKVWEDIDTLGYIYIWQCLLSF
ncbi:MAG: hypothetical protein A2173_01260 [Planctomycetes bacterium RBG_13_44_8b]|nr:MAG: hypothetical protein A2173_01260 [Planctomycetes bacterium RBG_13_44_8b]